MSDQRIRELERQVRCGTPGAREQLIYARIRAGFIPVERVTLAARAGDPACASHLGIEPLPAIGRLYPLVGLLFAWENRQPWHVALLALVIRVQQLPAVWEGDAHAQPRLLQAVRSAEQLVEDGAEAVRNRLAGALYGLPDIWPVTVLRTISQGVTRARSFEGITATRRVAEAPFRSLVVHWGTTYGLSKGPAEAERQIGEFVAATTIKWALDSRR